MHTPLVFVHIVTFNSEQFLSRCLTSLLEQSGFVLGERLHIHITDNASTDGSWEIASRFVRDGITTSQCHRNLGFCGGHNEGAFRFLESGAQFFLVLNPDIRLEQDAIFEMVEELRQFPAAGSVCAKLYRADDDLEPVSPPRLDSAGMILTPSLRHFDRGSDDVDTYHESEFVFGGTGACLMLRREFVESASLKDLLFEGDVDKLYPQLEEGRSRRVFLFDEAFFAYREDADLAWRGQIFGWGCRFCASARGYHRRVVLPTNRGALPALLNKLGVRNRFLLQLNNWSASEDLASLIPGCIFRNLVVIVGVILFERSSLTAFREILLLWRRAMERRRVIRSRRARK